MRFLIPSLLSLATLLSPLAAAEGEAHSRNIGEDKTTPSIFNGESVPPLKGMSGETLDQDISKGYWFVEFFSPGCPHCVRFAPTWQTLYEFYYTSKPLGAQKSSDGLNSFTGFYNFRFGRLNCEAFGDACGAKHADRYPSMIVFKDGVEVKKHEGETSLENIVAFVEDILESIKPGSRPKQGMKLPEVGASSVEGFEKESSTEGTSIAASVSGAPAPDASQPPRKTPSASTGNVAEIAKAKGTANPSGTSVPLTIEKFQKVVTNTNDAWFIKFYAPWCGHCQHLAPNWVELAREMKGKLNIGEVNCEADKKLCKDASVQGYPTLLLFRNGERVEYDGMRAVGDLVSFANSAALLSDGVEEVDADSFKKLESKEDVLFLYLYDVATTSEDFQALEKIATGVASKGKVVKTSDKKLAKRFKINTWPRLLVSRSGRESYYPPISPTDMRDTEQMLKWMKSVWLPLVPELTSANAHQIMNDKFVVLAVLNREHKDKFESGKREIKTAAIEWMDKQDQMFQMEKKELRDAKQLKIEQAEDRNDPDALGAAKSIHIDANMRIRKEVGFAWVDGIFWDRWLHSTYGIDVKDGARVIINDEANHKFWDVNSDDEPIPPSRTAILDALSKVVTTPPQIPPKSTVSWIGRLYYGIRNGWAAHPWFLILGVIGALMTVSYWSKGSRRRGFGNFHMDGKDGLLGGPISNGKND